MKYIIFLTFVVLFTMMSNTTQAGGYTRYGAVWPSLPYSAKQMYIEGYTDGLVQGITDATFGPIAKKESLDADLLTKTIQMHSPRAIADEDVLIRVMDEIYSDPSNMYVNYNSVLDISTRKIAGDPIEALLVKYRKMGQAEKEVNTKITK